MITLPKGWITVSSGGRWVCVQVSRITSIELADHTEERKTVIRFGGPNESGWITDEPPESLFARLGRSFSDHVVSVVDL